jgi:5-methyltetrahydrofolate--homocysteine methyltransferase
MASFGELAECIIAGQSDRVTSATRSLLAEGKNPVDIINQGLIAGMNVVGARFKACDMFVPEVLMSAKAMGAAMEIVKPLIADSDMPSSGKILIGTVKGDLHDIGKNLVAMMLESAGFTVINLGIDIGPERFVDAIREYEPDIVGLSALLTTTMPFMKETIELLTEEGLRDKVKIMVGGAPISQAFADQVGADGFASDAASAADLCRELLSVR